ncbi:MAG: hypothetical protein CVV23_09345 [Ignavibacteriae bacterium HGW-Ignavibacteriae-2]|jgi:hypothetical protein|nr:MAG: hypothetical protein CVV23_09345 [Ignavibacteriae bacterium HGW-Ignavibacteriae-2]
MKQINDDLLNKYIDGELTRQEIDELEYFISTDPSSLEKLKTLKMVDEVLKKMQRDKAPANVTKRVMSQITSAIPDKYNKNHFFVIIISFFVLTIIGLLSYILTSYVPSQNTSSYSNTVIEKINLFILSGVGQFTSIIGGNNFHLIVASIMLIVMFTIYFLFESHKSFKKKLDSVVH